MTVARSDVALSCVVDDVDAIWKCIVPWLATATMLAGVAPERIYLHHVGPLPAWLARLCRRLGVPTFPVMRFDPENPYSNKIRQCSTSFGANEIVVLSDVDIAFVRPFPLDGLRGFVAGKPVDRANPPIDVLREIFAQAGIQPLQTCANSVIDSVTEVTFQTLLGNFNGGLYVVPRAWIGILGEAWERWAHWLGDRRTILREWHRHLDQVSFCMALTEIRLPTRVLDDRWNYPAHLRVGALAEEPFAIHHHNALDGRYALATAADPFVRSAVERANAAIADFCRTHLH